MANMALNIEQRLGQKLTNEQQILWDYMLSRWPNLTFQPIVIIGAAGELSIYNASKLYIAYSLVLGTNAASNVGIANGSLFNELNGVHYNIGESSVYWDVTAAAPRHISLNSELTNVWFSRILINSGYSYFKFIGYRLTI